MENNDHRSHVLRLLRWDARNFTPVEITVSCGTVCNRIEKLEDQNVAN